MVRYRRQSQKLSVRLTWMCRQELAGIQARGSKCLTPVRKLKLLLQHGRAMEQCPDGQRRLSVTRRSATVAGGEATFEDIQGLATLLWSGSAAEPGTKD